MRLFNSISQLYFILIAIFFCFGCSPEQENPEGTPKATETDPLASWNEGASKQAIFDFVKAVTNSNGEYYVPPAKRIATFDNDGTLLLEKPMYSQLLFALNRVGQLAPDHPEWKTEQPFKAILENDRLAMSEFGKRDLLTLVMATHTGMSPEAFETIASDWMTEAKHPTLDRLIKECTYKPMLELLDYLRANEFKTFIVSAGGVEFVRAYSNEVYGIPPEQVIGSSVKTKFEAKDGKYDLIRLPELYFIDDKADKPVGINQYIGQRPIAAFGNSDGDLQMLQYTSSGPGKPLMVFIHHDDEEREYAYDRESKIGHFDKGLDEAREKDWTLVSMKKDWKVIF